MWQAVLKAIHKRGGRRKLHHSAKKGAVDLAALAATIKSYNPRLYPSLTKAVLWFAVLLRPRSWPLVPNGYLDATSTKCFRTKWWMDQAGVKVRYYTRLIQTETDGSRLLGLGSFNDLWAHHPNRSYPGHTSTSRLSFVISHQSRIYGDPGIIPWAREKTTRNVQVP